MTQFEATMAMKSKLSKAITAFLLLSLGAGCGTSSGTTTGTSPNDGGDEADAHRSTHDGGSADSMSSKDDGTGSDETTPGDDGSVTDDGSVADDNDAAADGNVVGDENPVDGPKDVNLPDGVAPSSTPAVDLKTAINYVILAESAITNVATSAITGNLAVSPMTDMAITGFSLTEDATKVFSTSAQITGKVYAVNNLAPTPANLTQAVKDMMTAYTNASGRAPDFTELYTGTIGGHTLTPGVYKWGTDVLIPTDVTLTGSSNDVFIFEIAQDLKMSSATHVVLSGGVVPKNIFWQVAGAVDIGTTAQFAGVILTKTMIKVETGASVDGRLFAQTQVVLQKVSVVEPAQ
jgi:hypothetical protein